MKTCKMDDRSLMAYVDGELAGEAEKQVAKHVEGCSECRGEVALLQRLSRQVARARTLSQDRGVDIEGAIMERVRRQRRPGQGWWRRLRFIWDSQTSLTLKWAAVRACKADEKASFCELWEENINK